MLDFQLSGVPRALLIPLWSRAKATRANNKVISDPKAVEIVEKLGFDFEELERGTNPTSEFFQVARARALDDLVRALLARHPKAVVVSLGAGLDTAFHRIDNGQLRWFDVDLPPVIELRKQLIPETVRSRAISASLLDPGWVQRLAQSLRRVSFRKRSPDLFYQGRTSASLLHNGRCVPRRRARVRHAVKV